MANRLLQAAAVGAMLIGVAIYPETARAQHASGSSSSGGATAAPSRGGSTHGPDGAGPHRPAPPTRPSEHTRTFDRFANPPFPNIATPSGPLPNTTNSGRALHPNESRDVFRVPGRRFYTPTIYPPGYFYGGYGSAGYDTGMQPPPPAPAPMPTGTLRLAVTPLSTQVFVDGYYEGTVEDLGRGLPLPEGPHTIELRADGYMPTTFDVRIAADSAVSYRGTLDLQREPPAAAPAQASTMYVIPGCYMGNVPPRAERIGANCDVHKVRVIPPQSASRAR